MSDSKPTHKLYLNVLERITIVNPASNLLPQKGGISTMREADNAIKTIAISAAEEVQLQGIPLNDARLLAVKEFEVTDFIYNELKEALRKLSEKNELNRTHLSLWSQIIEGTIVEPPPASN